MHFPSTRLRALSLPAHFACLQVGVIKDAFLRCPLNIFSLWALDRICCLYFFSFSLDNSCFNLKYLSPTIHSWVSYKYTSANAHIWALDILLSPECCEWQVTVSWSKYGVHLTTARVHSPKRRILTTKHYSFLRPFFWNLVLTVFNWRDREDWMVYVVSTPHLS